tara:strand:- start:1531 stop:1959 length:429 start_codon:yes stop_codon:yes gene_type:complete
MEDEMKQLLGKVFTSVEKNQDNNQIIFTTSEGVEYKMYHYQDCCESVSIEDINGDLNDLVGKPILLAETTSSSEHTPEQLAAIEKEKEEEGDDYYSYEESFTWTFYKLATIKGYVDIRWYGESNGYYSESVSIVEVGSDDDW